VIHVRKAELLPFPGKSVAATIVYHGETRGIKVSGGTMAKPPARVPAMKGKNSREYRKTPRHSLISETGGAAEDQDIFSIPA